MNPGSKRIAAVAVVAIVVCLAFSYAVQDQTRSEDPVWYMSNLDEYIPDTRPDAVDDFYTWANYEYLTETPLPEGGVYTGFQWGFDARWGPIVDSIVGSEGEWEVLTPLWNLVTDAEARNELGAGALTPYIDGILSIRTPEDYSSYFAEGPAFVDYAQFVPMRDADGGTALEIGPYPVVPTGLDPEAEAEFEEILVEMLALSGFDRTEAERIVSVAVETDAAVMAQCGGTMEMTTLAAIEEAYPDSVLYETFSAYGFPDYCPVYVDPSWIGAAQSLVSDGDMDDVRCQTLVRFVTSASEYLDEGFQALADRLSEVCGIVPDGFATRDEALALCELDGWVFAKVYSDSEVDPGTRETFRAMCEQIRDAYAGLISECSWMSDETKANALAKLDAIRFSVAECDLGMDLDDLDIDPDGSLLDGYLSMREFTIRTMGGLMGEPFDADMIQNSVITTANAYYNLYSNTVAITSGMLRFEEAMEERGPEAVMTTYMAIAHEISHAFDNDGSHFDENGWIRDWWTGEDRAAYDAKVSALSGYLSGIELTDGVYLDGDRAIGEVMADLSSLQCLMLIASQDPSFDYASFFVTLAEVWAEKYGEPYYELVMADAHPPMCTRINIICQQVPQFQDAFGVTEGDGMWLDPDDRFQLW